MSESRSRCCLSVCVGLLALLFGCTADGGGSGGPVVPVLSQPVVLDGEIDEWPPSVVMTSDEWWVYFRWKVAGPSQTLQASTEPLTVWLDLDTNPATGLRPDAPRGATRFGVDLAIEFSPIGDNGPGHGVRIVGYDAGGPRTLGHEDVGFSFAPTYAGEWYEGRVSRTGLRAAGLPTPRAGEPMTGMLVLHDSTGAIVGQSEPFEADAVAGSPIPPRADLRLPPKSSHGVRVLSWNVLRGKPMEDAGPFARVLKVLDPDVVLVQEWTSSPREIAAWFNASVPLEQGEWEVRTTAGWGVAVVSRFPLEPLGHDELYLEGEENAVRFAGALIDTPLGYLAAASVHLKCCGSSGSPEDQQRISEAGAINRSMLEALTVEPVAMRIITGDLNLVGSRPPLEVLRNGLDADGSDLEIADARVLGDAAYFTWREDDNAFSPGRLDFAVYSGSAVRQARAFVLDARVLSDRALETAGLDATDTDASDHLPLVIDLMPN